MPMTWCILIYRTLWMPSRRILFSCRYSAPLRVKGKQICVEVEGAAGELADAVLIRQPDRILLAGIHDLQRRSGLARSSSHSPGR